MPKKAIPPEELDEAIVEAVRSRHTMTMGGVRRLFGAHAESRVHSLVQKGVLAVDVDMIVRVR